MQDEEEQEKYCSLAFDILLGSHGNQF